MCVFMYTHTLMEYYLSLYLKYMCRRKIYISRVYTHHSSYLSRHVNCVYTSVSTTFFSYKRPMGFGSGATGLYLKWYVLNNNDWALWLGTWWMNGFLQCEYTWRKFLSPLLSWCSWRVGKTSTSVFNVKSTKNVAFN